MVGGEIRISFDFGNPPVFYGNQDAAAAVATSAVTFYHFFRNTRILGRFPGNFIRYFPFGHDSGRDTLIPALFQRLQMPLICKYVFDNNIIMRNISQ